MWKLGLIFAIVILVAIIVALTPKLSLRKVAGVTKKTAPIASNNKVLRNITKIAPKHQPALHNSTVPLIKFSKELISDESVFAHIDFIPRFGSADIQGVEVRINSDAYSLEDFGLLTGDIITSVGERRPTNSEAFKEIMINNIKYGTVLVGINRNNVEYIIELELN